MERFSYKVGCGIRKGIEVLKKRSWLGRYMNDFGLLVIPI